jgi:hypothetical protein
LTSQAPMNAQTSIMKTTTSCARCTEIQNV